MNFAAPFRYLACDPTAQGRCARRLGFTEETERVLLAVMLGMRESS